MNVVVMLNGERRYLGCTAETTKNQNTDFVDESEDPPQNIFEVRKVVGHLNYP